MYILPRRLFSSHPASTVRQNGTLIQRISQIVLMNQVTTRLLSNPTAGDRDGTVHGQLAPALGESWAHCCTNRVMLEWDMGGNRQARLLKSPSQRSVTVPFVVNALGIRGVTPQEGHRRTRNQSASTT